MNFIVRILVMAIAIAPPVLGTRMHAQTTLKGREENQMKQARGSVEVKIAPAESSTIGKEGGIGRMTIDKNLNGEIVGTTKGEMLTCITQTTGAMAYVALETVTATLDGRSGTFVFIHTATMNKTDPQSQSLQVSVVPGSGTGGLTGISGKFSIHIDPEGKHTYT